MRESWKTRFFRYGINIYPMFFGTGGRVTFIAGDWSLIIVRLKLNLWTRNYVGTIFGGSQFAATDPMYMLMLFHRLGPEFVVWDKSASIRFKRPSKERIEARFELTDAEYENIKRIAREKGEYQFDKSGQWVDGKGNAISTFEKTLYVATKDFYKKKQLEKAQAKSSK